MVPFVDLWLPILVSAVSVFLASSILHMVLTYHRRDYRRLPREEEALAALRSPELVPGLYFFPYCAGMKEAGSPEMQEKFRRGPVGLLTVRPSGTVAMGKHLALWFGFCLLVSAAVAWLAGRVLAPGALAEPVFWFAAVAAFMGYGLGELVDAIWKSQPWGNTLRAMLDGLVYALATGGVFAWLWPA